MDWYLMAMEGHETTTVSAVSIASTIRCTGTAHRIGLVNVGQASTKNTCLLHAAFDKARSGVRCRPGTIT